MAYKLTEGESGFEDRNWSSGMHGRGAEVNGSGQDFR
jgi:hypothetical protein